MSEEQLKAVYCPNCFTAFVEGDLPSGACPYCKSERVKEIIEELRELGYFGERVN